jgi:phosphotriesterase-related protein
MIEKARDTLRKLGDDHGVRSIVDPTVPGLGRDIRAVKQAIEGTKLNVIAATGWYTFRDLPVTFMMKDHEGRIDELIRLFMLDIDEGMEGTDVKPGVIKVATDEPGLTPDVEAVLRAAARTSLRSGLPIVTHTNCRYRSGLLQQEVFRQEGVDLRAAVIGHCNTSNDLNYLEELINAGSYIGFDQCGKPSEAAPLEVQVRNLAELCRRGYANRVMLAHDNAIFYDLVDEGTLSGIVKFDDYPYRYLGRKMLPELREAGVTDEQLRTMLVDNPREYFERAA